MNAITDDKIGNGLKNAVTQILNILPQFTDKFPKAYSEGNFYYATENVDWTTGFWTGEIWLAYEYVTAHEGEFEAGAAEKQKNAGFTQIKSFLHRIDNKIEVDHHDMGFLYSPSCVAGYKLTGSEEGREAAIKAADQLLTRYHPVGEFLQAWGPMDQPENYRLIIDCLNNLPLLYWASDATGDSKYREIADKHINTAVSNVIRDDYSTWHTFFLIWKQAHRTTEQPVRATVTVRRGQEDRHGAYTALQQLTAIPGERNIFRFLKMLQNIFLTIFPRIWYPTGIWNLPTVITSREILPVRQLLPAVCWK